jgi:hypothetical protein
MKKLSQLISCVVLMLIAVLSLTVMTACDNNEKNDTEMIVENPVTGEVIKDKEIIIINYDGNPKIFTPRVKCDSKYLEDVEINTFVNSTVSINNDNYPIEIGEYDMQFSFNFGDLSVDYEDYKPCEIEFRLKIKQETRTLEENHEQEAHVLSNGDNNFNFTASENGYYTFETFGDIKNFIYVDEQIGEYKQDNINQFKKVKLLRGQECVVKTELYDKQLIGVYNIKATFTPQEIKANDNIQINIKAGETEYLLFNPIQSSAYDIKITNDKTNEIGYAITEELYNKIVVSYKTDTKIESSFFGYNDKHYFIRILNIGNTDAVFNVNFNESELIDFEKSYNTNSKFDKIYKLNKDFSSIIIINTSGQYSSKLSFINNNFQTIDYVSGSDNKISKNFIQNNTYYIKIKPYAKTEIDVIFKLSPKLLILGNNNINKKSNRDLYLVKSEETNVELQFSSDNSSIEVYNTDWQRVDNYSKAIINKNQSYYIISKGNITDSNIKIDVITSDLVDTFNSEGFAFLEYTANRTGDYLVEGNSNFQWYNEVLVHCNSNLVNGYKYYLKINGTALNTYDINISYDAPTIYTFTTININAGYYELTIDEQDSYSIKTNCSNNVSSSIVIYDSLNNAITERFSADNQSYILTLAKGVYYFDLIVNNGTMTTLSIININGSAPLTTDICSSSNSLCINMIENQSYYFNFDCKLSDNYMLKLTTTKNILEYSIEVYYTLNNELKYVDTQLNNIPVLDNGTSCLGFTMQLNNNRNYIIKLNCYNQGNVSTSINFAIPSKINSITLTNKLIYNDGIFEENLHAVMGTEYLLNIHYYNNSTEKANLWKISSSQNPNDIATAKNLNLNIGINNQAIDKTLTLIFVDDYKEYTITFKIKYPYYAKATISKIFITLI